MKSATTKPQAAHTPGPWKDHYGEDHDIFITSHNPSTGNECVARVHLDENARSRSQANARLIAAAPETKAQRDELLVALIQTRAALAELQNYIPMRYNRELQRLLASDQELIERAGGEV